MALHLVKAAAEGVDRLLVRLHPAELGSIEIRLEFGQEGKLAALISAERSETLQALQREAGALQRSLEGAGLRLDSGGLAFSLRQENGRGERDPGGAGVPGWQDAAATPEESLRPALPPLLHPALAFRLLDIRA